MDLTMNRRTLRAGLAAGTAAATIGRAWAQAWKAQYPELVYAVVPAENATGVTDRFTPFVAYLGRELGTKTTLRIANDYAAVIDGHQDGTKGYYSVFYVLAKNSYQNIQDLKGRNLGLVDPNSTSGYNV